jgi:hypothetical protein
MSLTLTRQKAAAQVTPNVEHNDQEFEMENQAAVWTGSIATLLAVIVALFKEEIIKLWRKPKLEARIILAAPDCHKTKMDLCDQNGAKVESSDCFYLRLWIENTVKRKGTDLTY